MELKMYVFGENEGAVTWVVAENEGQAVRIFEDMTDIAIKDDIENPEQYVREANPQETMTYYHDLVNPEKDTMQNLIKKYCEKPDIFATSEF